MSTRWDPAQYLRYAGERERPFWELVARITTGAPRDVVDLGCGPGTATAGLAQRWPEATITGLDSSPEMIERASALRIPGRLQFALADAGEWTPAPASLDVIVSNATLQWVPGHVARFEAWLAALRPGGTLAFQVPANFDAPSHTLLRDLATSPGWRDRLGEVGRRVHISDPRRYHRELRALGAQVDAWETTYLHALHGADPVLDWVRGTALRPYLSVLDAGDAAAFSDAYAADLRAAYPPEPTGETLLPFRRIFVVATPAA
ncbi:trans-aconitate 2-methyltransferase [Acidiferrimicrobium sp. IK]|uniref:trans-aconitate 2-methyltransferase n=1 Tax=Acidiferrimicrobium sp. IK TaxID=2871700 RepID=UPI0021CB2E77|nr:trans-aconitate 2-methyltransferase [Acidiferrimicrobium sp. IK]MCU4185285.1 trans-aconitate 2-methyltransferase [Acidiferrimicrobium sp. IK]